ncbi:MAG: transporter substrate-binding domain-containing protein [Azonexus sp.]|jgi:TRAP-type uncharacterized transport system substrate-binding protein|nr:transporter substrate-binding domain-containing protein [Azonexus sp.]
MISRKIKDRLLSLRDLVATAWWIILIVGIGFVVAYQFVKPAPPSHLVISTGGKGSSNQYFAKRYAAILEKSGITLEIQPAGGSLESFDKLKKGEVDIAFVSGGVIEPPEDPEAAAADDLYSLGSVFYEPVWVFYRSEARRKPSDPLPPPLTRLADLRGKRIATTQEDSGARQLLQRLLEANEIKGAPQTLASADAVSALQKGRVDAVFIVAPEKTPTIRSLLQAPGVQVMSFSQARAYQRRFPFLTRLTLPQGAVDLVRNHPPRDTYLLAPTASLIVRGDLHPALQNLLLQAASKVHGGNGFFQSAGEFPSYMDETLPLSPEAARYYKSGPPFLQRYLPFWLAVLIERLVVLLVPVIALLIPLLRFAPALYNWRVRAKVFRSYGELRYLEDEIRHNFDPAQASDYRRRLDAIDEAASELNLPLGFSDLIYTLREHVDLVRQELSKQQDAAKETP